MHLGEKKADETWKNLRLKNLSYSVFQDLGLTATERSHERCYWLTKLLDQFRGFKLPKGILHFSSGLPGYGITLDSSCAKQTTPDVIQALQLGFNCNLSSSKDLQTYESKLALTICTVRSRNLRYIKLVFGAVHVVGLSAWCSRAAARNDFKAAWTWPSAKPMEQSIETASGSNLVMVEMAAQSGRLLVS